MMRKMVSLVLALTLLLSLASCGTGGQAQSGGSASSTSGAQAEPAFTQQELEEALEASIPKLSEEKVELTFWYVWGAGQQMYMDDLNDTVSMQKLEELTNVHINWVHPAIGTEGEIFSTMLASPEKPDMIFNGNLADVQFVGGAQKALDDGIIIPLNDLINEYAPAYQYWRTKDESIARDTSTDDGTIWTFSQISDGAEPPFSGLTLRKDWLTKLGLEMPVTIDDWDKTLRAVKEAYPDAIPLMIDTTGYYESADFMTAYGVGPEFYQKDNVVHYGPLEDGYKEYLTLMNKWYEDGLLDPSFTSRNSEMFSTGGDNTMWATDQCFASQGFWIGCGNASEMTLFTPQDPDFQRMAVQSPVLEEGDQLMGFGFTNPTRGWTVITSECENPELAAQWLNIFYTNAGMLLMNYGIEGEQYELDADGNPVYTEAFMNDPVGATNAIWRDFRCDGPGNVDFRKFWQVMGGENQLDAYDQWMKNKSENNSVDAAALSSDESRTYASIMGDIETFVGEATVQFIMGTRPLDQYDAFVEQLRSMGIEEALSIKQAAWDRYCSR